VTGLRKSYSGTTVVDDVDMEIAAGEFVTFLGSSGSGKTTTLMMLAGFTEPDSGRIAVDGRDITRLNPGKRDFGFVFQQYLLFPHMTVSENVAFPLQLRGVAKEEIRRRVGETLEAAGLSKFAGRKPRELSGGQQQRVALCSLLPVPPAASDARGSGPSQVPPSGVCSLPSRDRSLRSRPEHDLVDVRGRLRGSTGPVDSGRPYTYGRQSTRCQIGSVATRPLTVATQMVDNRPSAQVSLKGPGRQTLEDPRGI
jgi:ABC-type transport system involved in cytochrome c biogenesis ATPase subunit